MFARECAKWADETDTNETRKAFLDLARDWSFAALTVEQEEIAGPSCHVDCRVSLPFIWRAGADKCKAE